MASAGSVSIGGKRIDLEAFTGAVVDSQPTLKKPRVEDDLFPHLLPGREACLYVVRMGRSPVVFGVKYADGSKHLITKTYLRDSSSSSPSCSSVG